MADESEVKKSVFASAIDWLANLKPIRTAPPARREVWVAYMLLGRRNEEGALEPVGAFSPELYELALARKLPYQIENEERLSREDKSTVTKREELIAKSLVYQDGKPKNEFALAIIPFVNGGKIESYFKKMTTFKDRRRVDLPPHTMKLNIEEEYFSELKKAGLEPYETVRLKSINDKKVDYNVYEENTTAWERILHYATQKLATLLSVFFSIQVATAFGWTFPGILLSLVLGYSVNWAAKSFVTFDLAEDLLRSAWVFDRKHILGKVDFRKSLKTVILLAGAGFVVYEATIGTWSGVVSDPMWRLLGSIGAPGMVVTALSLSTAGAAAFTAAVGTSYFMYKALSYFNPLSFYNKNIDVEEIKEVADKLPAISITEWKKGGEVSFEPCISNGSEYIPVCKAKREETRSSEFKNDNEHEEKGKGSFPGLKVKES